MLRRWLSGWMALAIALLLPCAVLHADDQPAVPTLSRHVTDLTGTLTPQQIDQLDAQLVNLEKQKGAQLVVLMVGTTQPDDFDDYSLRVAEQNKLGRKGVDDGVLLLIAKNDRQVRIEVGYGLEGAIPDAASARIIREYIAPKFRSNDYAGGINDAVGALTQLIDGEPLPPPVHGNDVERRGTDLHGVFFLAIFAVLFLRGVFGRAPALVRAPIGGLVVGGLLWLLASAAIGIFGGLIGAAFMLLPAGAGRSIGGGGWGGFGGGGFGGGGGGGFSGGGGSFGGGGASGSW
ncbi:TPM domain-containing protein [Dyella acidiphila]|uniref:YgcG family protein n=1 Tax=Dyella acidiphila TaxID=2775866 RepID=A0ABR9G968_9GAMM|nr:YgcG family protein [Dyella acidiphila]MBE1160592.1 YgcG family protein [Dyella acidiphila]